MRSCCLARGLWLSWCCGTSNSRAQRPTRCSFVRDGGRGSHLLTWGLSFNRAARARPNPGFVERLRQSLLLAGDGLRLALAGTGVGVGALAAHRQLLAMAQAPIGAQIHQPLDVDRDLATKVAFDHIVAVDCLANLQNFRIRQLRHTPLRWDMHLLDNLFGLLRPDAVDILKRDDHALVGGNIDACNTSHSSISISAALDHAKSRAAGTVSTSGGGRPLSSIARERKKSHALGNGAGTQNDFGMGGM